MVSVLGDTNVVVFEVAYRSTTPCAAFIYQKESTERPNSHEVTKSPLPLTQNCSKQLSDREIRKHNSRP